MKKQRLEKFLANHPHFHSHALLRFSPEEVMTLVTLLIYFYLFIIFFTPFSFDPVTFLISWVMFGTGENF